MNATNFTGHPDVRAVLSELNDHFAAKPLIISDFVDGEGRQYVDLVQEGGGVWGIALLGYTYVLEQMGIHFASMAGTSAGAINTLLLASAAPPTENRTDKILDELANKNLFDFVDGNWFSRQTISAVVRGERKLFIMMRGIFNLRRIFRKLGLNPGVAFKDWLTTTIAAAGVKTTADLREKMNAFPQDIHHRVTGKPLEDAIAAKIAFIATEICTGTKVRFPYAASLFFHNYEQANPAEFVRASMSIPIFFEPVIIPRSALPANSDAAWQKLGHFGKAPARAVLVDGGILSNFPIDVFHRKGHIPRRPTLGVKLRNRVTASKKPKAPERLRLFAFLNGNFSAARHLRDQEFIYSNPDYQHLVAEIDVGPHHWMNFGIDDADKVDLFLRGARAAKDFLMAFDWEEYKLLRARLLLEDMEIRRAGIDLATGKAGDMLRKAMATRLLPLDEQQESTLLRRIEQVPSHVTPFRVLWVDDRPNRNESEKTLIRELSKQVMIATAGSSEEAETYLQTSPCHLMVSDIRRGDSPDEGLRSHHHMLETGTAVPTIFYINKYEPEKGVPKGAFGITNSPEELVHLVIDVMGRQKVTT